MIYYGKGFTHSDVYEMPVYLRKFYINKLVDTKDEEKKQMDKSTKSSKKHTVGKFNPARFKR